jgi:glycosyltransferase involved in cell wall biosynthesis
MVTKIMYLMDYYVEPKGGTEGQLLQLLHYLDRSRYEPALTVFRTTDYIEHNQLPCPVTVLGVGKLASIRSIFKVLYFALSLRRQQYRIVHCFFNDASLIAPPLLRLFGIRVVVSRRDMGFWHTPLNLAAFRLVSPFVDRYVVNSRAVGRVVRQREWVPHGRITVIYNGYVSREENCAEGTESTKLPGIPDCGPIVGMVANLRPIKRVDTVIEAFALIASQHPDAFQHDRGAWATGHSRWGS